MSFLKKWGLVEDEPSAQKPSSKQAEPAPAPTYFPVTPAAGNTPSFVQPVSNAPYQPQPLQVELDPKFIKALEDELAKANKPGFDYFEFRQALLNTQSKMQGKVSADALLQIVLTTVSVPPATLINEANDYKQILTNFAQSWIDNLEQEKSKKLQERNGIVSNYQNRINQIDAQLNELEQKRQQLTAERNDTNVKLEAGKNFGAEEVQKWEVAQQKMKIAKEYIVGTIDKDIQSLQTAQH